MNNKIKVNKNWNLLDYFYYKVTLYYSKSESRYGINDNKRRGSYAVGLFLSLNIESLIMLFLVFFVKKNTLLSDVMGFIIVGIFLFVIFYTIYIFEKKRHSQIFMKYKNEQLKQRKNREKILIIYIILTIVVFCTAVYLGAELWK
ncbi:MAG: hypothetical protein COB73_09505 [Flavobacteriaceae bacterium]|nr:MAG: hypothetical protein COB73_09505 [Flavobacteriaceae bacterium]